jgi:AhpD family alkylhydroperoxidase
MHEVPTLDRSAMGALGSAIRSPGALLARNIGPRLREQVILRVSSVNSCPACSLMHGIVARRAVGMSRAEIRAARAGAVADERASVALRFAELRTTGEEEAHPGATREFQAVFSKEEQREIRAFADLFTFMNRFMNSLESRVPGADWRRRKLGLGR